ncbi:DUF4349 domain-containing protein [Kitasatospora sp. NPDC057692]|uniref:DUF4349 domain-containing protein n=1 Tax=Kitasatospora sp. NPDC057692 TaxID=3346215 RepID=UPI0036A1974A
MAVTAALAAGCSASDGGGARDNAAAAPAQATAGEAAKGDSALGAPAEAAPAAPGAAATGRAAGPASAAPVVDARQIAYSAQLTVRAAKVDEALARARGLAVAAGGYVSAETASGTGGTGPIVTPQSGQVTVKVPSAAFQQTLDQLAGLGEVLSRRSQAEDLTQQVADVNSRMQSQQASVDRVRALMAQAKTLAEIVSLESELSRREADLESLQKQVKELSARTSLSTITLDVRPQEAARPDAPAAEEEDEGFWASVGSALGGGWHVLFTIVRGLFVAVAALLPFLLVAVPIAAAVWAVRRWWKRAAGRTGRDREPVPGFAPPPAGDLAAPEPEQEEPEEEPGGKPGGERRTP